MAKLKFYKHLYNIPLPHFVFRLSIGLWPPSIDLVITPYNLAVGWDYAAWGSDMADREHER